MRAIGWIQVLSAGFLVGLAGCGGGGSAASSGGSGGTTATGGSASACVPGEQIACACVGGAQGIQVCTSDGSAYGPCMGCPGMGGSGGAGGATMSGGTGGTTMSTGGTTMSTGGSAPSSLDLHDAILYDNPINMADWPVTTTITALSFQHNGMDGVYVDFSKKDGVDRWPDIVPPGWDGPLQYTLGMAEYINGQWYASAAIQYWYGLDASGGNIALDNQVAKNWYYDDRWGELNGRQPATGELIGIFVVAGNARGVHDDGSQSPMHERSDVVVVPMPDVNGADYTF